jgi:hypothetical protein
MPNATTWLCLTCKQPLGTAFGPTLAPAEAVPVLATPRGLVVTCPGCRAERLWSWKPRRAA